MTKKQPRQIVGIDPLDVWANKAGDQKRGECASKKINCDLTREWVIKQLKDQGRSCYYCKHPFDLTVSQRDRTQRHQPTLDRVYPGRSIGYVQSNVVIACGACNQLKADARPEELLWLAEGVSRFRFEVNKPDLPARVDGIVDGLQLDPPKAKPAKFMILIEGGEVFEGTMAQFEDCFGGAGGDIEGVKTFCKEQEWSVEFVFTN